MKKAFTIVELLIVLCIVFIIGTLIFSGSQKPENIIGIGDYVLCTDNFGGVVEKVDDSNLPSRLVIREIRDGKEFGLAIKFRGNCIKLNEEYK